MIDLKIRVYQKRSEMGSDAAKHIGTKMKELLKSKGKIRKVFATAYVRHLYFAVLRIVCFIPIMILTGG